MTILHEPSNVHQTELPTPVITSVSPRNIIPGQQKVTVIGDYLTDYTWIEFDGCETSQCESIEGKVIVSFNYQESLVSLSLGARSVSLGATVKRGKFDEVHFPNVVNLVDPQNFPETDKNGWIFLTERSSLTIGSNKDSDIRHRGNSPLFFGNEGNGIYLNKNGYIFFNFLGWERQRKEGNQRDSNNRTVDFVITLKGDRLVTLGLVSDFFDFNNTNPNQSIVALGIAKNKTRFCYGNKLRNNLLQHQLTRNRTYQIRINNNGFRGELMQILLLPSETDWENGELVWEEKVALNFLETGTKIYPAFFGANKATNLLRGIRVI